MDINRILMERIKEFEDAKEAEKINEFENYRGSGNWIRIYEVNGEGFKCSNCMNKLYDDVFEYYYCPYCGVRNYGEEI